MNICIYGASSNHIDKIYLDKSFSLSKELAKRGHTLVYGGGDNGVMGAKHRFYKIWKVSDYQVKKDQIDVVAFVWYAEKVMHRDDFPAEDGRLGDLTTIFENAERCKREFAIRRTLDNEEAILAMLESRKAEAASVE